MCPAQVSDFPVCATQDSHRRNESYMNDVNVMTTVCPQWGKVCFPSLGI